MTTSRRRANSLFPVLRGEGWGEGQRAFRVGQSFDSPINHGATNRTTPDSTRTSPLSPALSPEYREEGVRAHCFVSTAVENGFNVMTNFPAVTGTKAASGFAT